MKKGKKFLAMLVLAAVFLSTSVMYPREVFAVVQSDEGEYTPTVFTKITTQTDKIRVYVYRNTALKIMDKSGIIFQKTYKGEGKKTVKIPLQKAKTKLKFTLTSKYGDVGFTVTKTVKDDGVISKKKVNSSLKKPKVAGKVTDKSTSVKVYAKKGETLHIQNGKKVLKKVKYKKTGYQTLAIKKQKAETKLTFYVTDKKGRSAYVTKEVKDVTAPAKPKVCFSYDYDTLEVEGEEGTDIYVKQNSKHASGGWKYLGALEEDKPCYSLDWLPKIDKTSIYAGDTFSVRLVDDAGNKSEVATTESVNEEWINGGY